MVAYLLINLVQGNILKEFDHIGVARASMRRANAAAGWTRISRCWSGGVEMEWCARSNGLPSYKHGPYALTDMETWNQHFRETQRCSVAV